MDSEKPSVEELISTVLSDIQQKGYSSILPFDIGEVEGRMIQFAQANGVMLGSDRLYMSASSCSIVCALLRIPKGWSFRPMN